MKSIKESLTQLKNKYVILFQAIGYSWKCFLLTSKGQLPKYEVLQLSHRLEKGLMIENPKPLWGWEKAERIASLLKDNDDVFSNQTGRGVLKAYIDSKKQSGSNRECEKAVKFLESHPGIEKEDTIGGTLLLKRRVNFSIVTRTNCCINCECISTRFSWSSTECTSLRQF